MATTNNWNAQCYTGKHSFVYEYGKEVIDLMQLQPGERVLDLGCGTGQLTNEIANLGVEVVGIDASEAMIEQAKAAFPQIEFHLRDARDFSFDLPFDAVFSNAALHWILPPEPVAQCVYRALKPGGRFVAELGGKGNVHAILTALWDVLKTHGYEENTNLHLNYYPSIAEYATILEASGFETAYAVLFDRPTKLSDPENGIVDWLRMFKTPYLKGIPDDEREAIMSEAQELTRSVLYKDGCWYADYRRLRVRAVKSRS